MMSLLCLTKVVAFYPTDNEKLTRTFKQESCQIRLGQLCVYRATLTCIWRMGWRARKWKRGGQGYGVGPVAETPHSQCRGLRFDC